MSISFYKQSANLHYPCVQVYRHRRHMASSQGARGEHPRPRPRARENLGRNLVRQALADGMPVLQQDLTSSRIIFITRRFCNNLPP